MAKALKVVGVIAGVVAVVATAGAALGLGLAIGGAVISAATIATVASVVAMAASFGAQALTKPPPARGSVTRMLIDPDAPTPYVMGEGLFAGTLRHQTAYGATLNDVPNPYLFMVVTYSLGPAQSISPRVDYDVVGSYYNTFLYTDTQTGECPESTALTPQWSGAPGWGSASKLSGLAAIGWSLKFDKEGKRFASGVPLLSAYGQWVKIYDPRLDSSQPGGSGSHVLGDETTYTYSENPALHAGMYAYGRYQNGKRVMGVGLPADAIDWLTVMAWANVCEDNDWTLFGVVYEPGDRWANLTDICLSGGGEPVATGVLTFRYHAPVVALDTITIDDLTDDEQELTTMQPYRDRINTAIPKYRSPLHNWELIDAAAVVNSTFLNEDGEEKREVWNFNFVKNPTQASQLAAYRLFESREISPITLICKPRLRHYRPGECLHISLLDEAGLDIPAIILKRHLDPQTLKVTLTLISETTAKHAYCLGQTGTPPPTPALSQTAEERDELSAAATRSTYNPRGAYSGAASYAVNDLVLWQVADGGDGNSYVRIGVGDTTGIDPSDGTKWKLFLEGGVPGAQGETGAGAFTLIPQANVTVGPDWIEKVSGGAAWDAGAYSGEVFVGGCTASFTVTSLDQLVMLGINSAPASSAGYLDLDHSIALTGGFAQVFEEGLSGAQTNDPVTIGDILRIQYDNSTVRYFRNATLLREVPKAADLPFYLDASLFYVGNRIANIRWVPSGARGLPGTVEVISLRATQTQAKFDGTGAYVGGAITLVTTRENIPSGAVWGWRVYRVSDGTLLHEDTSAALAASFPLIFSSTGPENLTWTAFGVADGIAAYGSIRFEAYSDGYADTDSVSVVRVQDGASGADGSPGAPGDDGTDGVDGAPGDDGTDGVDGADGYWRERVFKVSATQPDTPTGNGIPSGWTDDPTGGSPEWQSWSKQELDGTLVSGEVWSTPVRFDGPPGDDGDDGADGAAGFTIPPSKSFAISCLPGGTPKTGEFNKVITMRVLQGITDISDDAATTYSVSNTSINATMGGTNNKVYTATGITATTGKSTITISRSGVPIGEVVVDYIKLEDGSSATAGFDDTLDAMPNSTTLVQIAGFTLAVTNGTTLSMGASVSWNAFSGLYPGAIAISYQNITDGGSETFSSQANGDITATSGEAATASISGYTVTNSTGATKSFTVRLYGRRTAGSGNSANTIGVVEGSAA